MSHLIFDLVGLKLDSPQEEGEVTDIIGYLNSLVDNDYEIFIQSRGSEELLLEKFAALKRFCQKNYIEFPKFRAMAICDKIKYPNIPHDKPTISYHMEYGLNLVCYGDEVLGEKDARVAFDNGKFLHSPASEYKVLSTSKITVTEALKEGYQAQQFTGLNTLHQALQGMVQELDFQSSNMENDLNSSDTNTDDNEEANITIQPNNEDLSASQSSLSNRSEIDDQLEAFESKVQMITFAKIYTALYKGQKTIFKTDSLKSVQKENSNDSLLAVITKSLAKPESRTAIAWKLTKDLYANPDKENRHGDLIKGVYDWSYNHSGIFKRSSLKKDEDGNRQFDEDTVNNAKAGSRLDSIAKALEFKR